MAKVSKATAATLPAGTGLLVGSFCAILVLELVEPFMAQVVLGGRFLKEKLVSWEAFPKHSGCFQLESDTRTIGSHRGDGVVLQVGLRQLSILKREVQAAGAAERRAALEFSAFNLQDFSSPQGTFVSSCQVGPPRGFLPLTSSARAARGPCRRHGAAREPPPEGPRRPRRDPLRAGGLHQPPLLPHRGGQQPARPRREVPGAARLPGPAAQRARREGGGAQPGAAALLAGLRRAALPARREAPGAGGVPAAAPHDGDRRREAAPAATARAANRGCPCGGLGRDRHRHRNRALTRPGREGPERPRTAPTGTAPARGCSHPGLHRPGAAPTRDCFLAGPLRPQAAPARDRSHPEPLRPSRAPGLSRPVGPSDAIKTLPLHSAPSLCCFFRSVRAHRCHVWCMEEALLLPCSCRSVPGGNSPGVPWFQVLCLAVLYCNRAVQRLRASLAQTDANTSAAGFLFTLQRGSGAVCSFKSKRERSQSLVTHCPSPSLQVLLFNPIFHLFHETRNPPSLSYLRWTPELLGFPLCSTLMILQMPGKVSSGASQ